LGVGLGRALSFLRFGPGGKIGSGVKHAAPKFSKRRTVALEAPTAERDRGHAQKVGRLYDREENMRGDRCSGRLKWGSVEVFGAHEDLIRAGDILAVQG
jgi:hypothetical protein